MNTFLSIIDKISEISGKLFAWLIIPLVGGLLYEVTARYIFNAPTIWAYDMTYILYGVHFMMGAAYLLSLGGHIRIDVFYQRLSPRNKAIVDICGYLLLFFPVMAALLVFGTKFAAFSWQMKEKAFTTAWLPIIYPFKAVFPIGIFLLLLQGIAIFIRNLRVAVRGA